MGGAQAIAAFAFGTETVPRADRIVGPGNVYVTAAKKLLAGEAGIDFIAGPTEIVLISADGHPRLLAADMLAQAEHDVDASAILLTTSRKLAAAVAAEVAEQLEDLPTRAVASKAIAGNSAIVVTRTAQRSRGYLQPLCARAPDDSQQDAAAAGAERRQRLHRPVEPGSGRRLRRRAQSRAADQRRGRACAAGFPCSTT